MAQAELRLIRRDVFAEDYVALSWLSAEYADRERAVAERRKALRIVREEEDQRRDVQDAE
jgi:hypothetical protein